MGNNSAKQFGQGFGAPFEALGEGIKDTAMAAFHAATGDTAQSRIDIDNAGFGFYNMLHPDDPKHAVNYAARNRQYFKDLQDPNSSLNRQWNLPSSSKSSSTNSSYQATDAVKPSQISAISNPATKMAIASTRGKQRSLVNIGLNHLDTMAAPMLQGQASMASDNTNSAGGQGHSTPDETPKSPMKDPNTGPTGSTQPPAPVPDNNKELQTAPTPDVKT